MTSHSVTVTVGISITGPGTVIGKYKVKIPAAIPTAMHHVSPTKQILEHCLKFGQDRFFPHPFQLGTD